MPLGREVGLGPGDIVLDRDPTPPKTGTAAPSFRPISTVYDLSSVMSTAHELLYVGELVVLTVSVSVLCLS